MVAGKRSRSDCIRPNQRLGVPTPLIVTSSSSGCVSTRWGLVVWVGRSFPGRCPHLYPHLLILLPSPCTRGEGLGVRGFALCFDWYFDREFNLYPRFRSVNKPLNRRLPCQVSPPHPPTPSPRSGARGKKRTEITQIHWDFESGVF